MGSDRSRQRRSSFRPRLEALEGRDCPSASAVVSGHTLLVTGDAGPHKMAITDDGHGNVSATVDNQQAVGGSAINTIVVNTGSGADTVSYKLTNPLANPSSPVPALALERVSIILGNVSDVAQLDFTAGVAKGYLAVGVAGDGQATADFGSIAQGAFVSASMAGRSGGDNFALNCTGKIDGILSTTLSGGSTANTVAANINVGAGSTGSVYATVAGFGAGSDNLTLNVNVDSTAHLSGLCGRLFATALDTVTATHNVTVFHV